MLEILLLKVFIFGTEPITSLEQTETKRSKKMVAAIMVSDNPSNVKYNCTQCNNIYNSATYLEAHIEAKHERKVGQNCNICDFRTTSVLVLRDHMKINHNAKFKCDMCGFETASKSDNDRHKKTFHLCGQCDFKSANPKDLTKHQKNSHKIRCTECDYELSTKKTLKVHIENIHQGKKYKCNKCDHVSEDSRMFNIHKKSDHDASPNKTILGQSLTEEKHTCTQCENVYKSMTYLTMHIKATHDQMRSYERNAGYKCDVCNFETSSVKILNIHKRSEEHTSEIKSNMKCACVCNTTASL